MGLSQRMLPTQHTTNTRDEHPCPQRNSNPQSQQLRGFTPTPPMATIFLNTIKADSHIACRAHAVPLPCRAAKGLECVFPIWFTQCGRVWLTLHIFMNQTRPHRVNQMRKTHSKPLAARHGRGTAWARHAMCESAFNVSACIGEAPCLSLGRKWRFEYLIRENVAWQD
jgi:hypothetical protein